MKKITIYSFFLCACILLLFNSCTIQKRTHCNGYYIDWKKQSKKDVQISESKNQKEENGAARNLVASSSNLIELESTNNLIVKAKKAANVCGDTLYLATGAKIICQVVEISDEIIKYKQCDNIDGPIYSTAKESVLKIVYINGISEQINSISPNNKNDIKSTSQTNPCGDTIFFKDGKIMACEIVDIKSDHIKYKKCDSLNRAEYYIDRTKVKNFVTSTFIVKTEPQVNYSKPMKQISRKVSPFSLAAFLSALASSGLFIRAVFSWGTFALSFSFIFFLLAIILGIVGLVQISNNREQYSGTALSVLAFVLPVIAYIGFFVVLLMLFVI